MNSPPTEESLIQAREKILKLKEALNEVLYGQESLIEFVLVGIMTRGHILLEGLPGLGKTELVKALAKGIQLSSKRIQFTPDLLPGDITGNPILQEKEGQRQFVFQPGPLFAHLVLADEINRASPKTQSALLEAMQERRVTVMGESHELPEPFLVLATQNPIELEGTYPLPEAQVDRFLFKLEVHRNPPEVIEKIVKNREIGISPQMNPVLDRSDLLDIIQVCRNIHLPDVVAHYIARLVNATHPEESEASKSVKYGSSPRAALALAAAAKGMALLDKRPNASFEDVQKVAVPVLQHRVLLTYAAKLEGKKSTQVVEQILNEIQPQDKSLPGSLKMAKI